MEPAVVSALVGAGGTVVGAAIVGPVIGHLLGRRARAAQNKLAEAQAQQLHAEAARIGQDVYQQLTADLRTELAQVRAALQDARDSLAATSAEAERLRQRVTDLESRTAQLERTEQHLSEELRAVQAERDQLRIQLAGRDATITALTAQIGDLKAQTALLQPRQP